MHLQLLTTRPGLSIFYDADNEWLYLDWQGHLTLEGVQEGCLAVAQSFLIRNYTRVLNDNSSVTSYSPEVAAWLATEFLPYMELTSIDYIAWTYSPSVDTRSWTNSALHQITKPVVALFDDMESAYAWLQAACYRLPGQGESSLTKQTELRGLVQEIASQLNEHRQRMGLAS